MPQMANVTVKAANGSTDVVFTALTSSGGDKAPARWRVEDPTKPVNARIAASVRTEDNGPKTARRMIIDAFYPTAVTNSSTNVTTVAARAPMRLEFTLPTNVPQANNTEAAAILLNFAAAQLVKDSAASGYAPT